MSRFEDTTVLLRPVQPTTKDPWDDGLRLARPVEYDERRTPFGRWAHWLVPTVLTGLLAAIGLARPGLWTDELATWGMATTPWHEFWPVLRYVDAVLAPYYTFMHVWVSVFGDSDIALRTPSLLAMAASAGLVGAVGNRLAGRRVGVIAGTVFAMLPSTSRFAAEARPYALSVLVACLATWLLLRAWEHSSTARWVAYGASVAVLGWLSIVAFLLLAAHAWLIAVWRRDLWWRFVVAAIAATATSIPILIYGARQRQQVAYIPHLRFDAFTPYGQVLFGTVPLAIVIVMLALFSLPLRRPSAFFTAWALVPTLALIAVSLVMPMFLPRYLLFTTPGWALLAGAALSRLRPEVAPVALTLIATLTVPTQLHIRTPGGHDQATREAAAIIATDRQAGDGIVYADQEPVGSWTARDAITHYLTTDQRPRDVLATHPPRTDGLLLATECQDVAACVGNTPRLWVVRTGHLTDPLSGIGPGKQQVLAGRYRVTQVWYPVGLTVALLERSPTP